MSIKHIVKFASKSFTLPDTCVRLRSTIDNPKADIDDMAHIISLDPSLSGKVLKLANSALFRFPSQIETVPKALSVIGGEAAYNISIAETANVAFKHFGDSQIDFDVFWNDAVLHGVVAKSLAQQAQMRGSERFFALGILQALSELLVAIKFDEKYKNYASQENSGLPWLAQSAAFNFTFAQCSGHICEAWGLPHSLVMPLKRACYPPEQHLNNDDSILYVTMAMIHADKQGIELEHIPKINMKVLSELDLSAEDYDMVINFAKLESIKIAGLINS